MKNMVDVITKAVDHKGFSYVNIFTPCVTFNQFNTVEWYNGHLKKLADIRENYDPHDKAAAFHLLSDTDSLQLRFLKISVWNFGKIVLRRRFSAFGIKKTFINQILRFKQQLLEIAGLSRSVKGAFAS